MDSLADLLHAARACQGKETKAALALLAAVRDAGVKRLRYGDLEIEFTPVEIEPEPTAPFVDKDGKPLSLDEGAGPLAQDPDADLEAKNFGPDRGKK